MLSDGVRRRRLINKQEYSYPTDGTRAASCRTASRLNGAKKRRKNGEDRKKWENADAVTEARCDKSDDPTARATRPGISAEFSRVLLSAPNPLASPFFFTCVSVPEDLCIYTGRTVTASENDAGGCGGWSDKGGSGSAGGGGGGGRGSPPSIIVAGM